MDVNITDAKFTPGECGGQLLSLPVEPLEKHLPTTRQFEILQTDRDEVDEDEVDGISSNRRPVEWTNSHDF